MESGIPVFLMEVDYLLCSYDFALPEELVAQFPSEKRGEDRLYVLDRNQPSETDRILPFSSIREVLPPQSLLVVNNSRVVPARLLFHAPTGGKMELLLLTPLPLVLNDAEPCDASLALPSGGVPVAGDDWHRCAVRCLLRPGKKAREGDSIRLADDLAVTVLRKLEFGQCEAHLFWRGDLAAIVNRIGVLPLPPYIKREVQAGDMERYQTVFAAPDKAGSVAAPTAGLHFTPELLNAMKRDGHEFVEVTLFVGYGTFSPVRCDDIRDHHMHAEYAEISRETVDRINAAKREGRPVIAVGTTAARVLEGVAGLMAEESAAGTHEEHLSASGVASLRPYTGWINCFMYPGRPVRVLDGLITNFHLPESTLLMLVSALTGRERLLEAYRKAVEARMRFFSYGDAMLIL